jgi:exopolysaccharide biosynthesis predicted pyruvyltransferase EpsI
LLADAPAGIWNAGSTGKVGMEEKPIVQYLGSLPRDEKIYFFANPGGAGDALIALATYQLFNRLGIDYRIVDVSQPFEPAGKIMVYGGGGNLVEYYGTARKVIGKYYPFVKKLVILPHTIRANEDLLAGFRANADIICRERVSYEHVKKHASKANVLLMDDLAFCLDAASVVKNKSFSADLRVRRLLPRDFLFTLLFVARQLPGKISRPAGWRTLNAFRKDLESLRRPFPPDNVDLSTLFGHGCDSEALAFYVSRRVLKIIDRYRLVRTDRLHICIAAALLGKEVEFFSNSYYKCEAVYQFSMKDKYPHVHWMG